MKFKPLVLLAPIVMTACGAANTGGINGSAQPTATTNQPASVTSTTLGITPVSSPLAQLCSAYYLVLADNQLISKISGGSKQEAKAASTAYLAAIHELKTSPLSPPQLVRSQSTAELGGLDFSSATTKVSASAIGELTAALATSCKSVHANSIEAPEITSAATTAGWGSGCNAKAEILISAADPSYAVLESGPATSTSTTCLPSGNTGVLERESGQSWEAVLPYVNFPCGQAAPYVLLSLYGKAALSTCYPS